MVEAMVSPSILMTPVVHVASAKRVLHPALTEMPSSVKVTAMVPLSAAAVGTLSITISWEINVRPARSGESCEFELHPAKLTVTIAHNERIPVKVFMLPVYAVQIYS